LVKTPENLGKIPKYPGKHCAQRCFTSKKRSATFTGKQMKIVFVEVTSKEDLHNICGRKFVGKSRTTFRASLGKFGRKSFAPSKFAYSCTNVAASD